MHWTQLYTPVLDNLLLSAIVAALPVVVLLGLLALFHIRAHWAALAGLAAAILIALLVYRMPASALFASTLYGAAYGLFPIGWIIIGAIFVYDITVHTGMFEVIKQTVANLSRDRRLQLLLIAFSFGAFVEGAAGFGTPVAVSAAMLIGLGFRPLPAAGLALIGNTAPVAFGALGSPILALASVTNIPTDTLSAMIGRQLPFFSVLVPFWLIWAMAGWRGMLEVWPACLVAGLSFAITQFAVSNFFGPTLVDIAGALISILCLVGFMKIWHPRTTWQFPEEAAREAEPETSIPFSLAFRAWSPWLLLAIILFLWGFPPVKNLLNSISNPQIVVPFLHNLIFRAPPVVPKPTPETAVFSLNWLSATGTGLLLTGILAGLLLRLSPLTLLKLFGGTLWRLRFSLLTIAAMLALGYTTRYAGLDATVGLAFASTGVLFPFFSPLLGWLGVALTGSDTSSNVLFGSLQRITAEKLGFSPVLAAAANSSGGVMGKMIDAQSIVVAGVATGQKGEEGSILRYVFFHSLALAALVGLLVLLQAYVFPGMIP
ncbi:lactate permease [Thermosporothrix hazakensis]|jgi:lactate permease|uniref:L-lactate permease n=1 Tax=Thermosporothrix hazakensis TaxID=644383 RepID=A0A326U782_THEHA|nr:L-lactate permease [Thermosporothrix hazakensis]PZW29318.1 lactate permease [Thermosporothrix hazakensis]GCE45331.1 L-lactate permease [Thermosporothrix hazakensis]